MNYKKEKKRKKKLKKSIISFVYSWENRNLIELEEFNKFMLMFNALTRDIDHHTFKDSYPKQYKKWMMWFAWVKRMIK